MLSVEHASSTGPGVMEEGGGRRGGGGDQQASWLVAKQAVEFPQVLASNIILHLIHRRHYSELPFNKVYVY